MPHRQVIPTALALCINFFLVGRDTSPLERKGRDVAGSTTQRREPKPARWERRQSRWLLTWPAALLCWQHRCESFSDVRFWG
jgi:hypothetical protein